MLRIRAYKNGYCTCNTIFTEEPADYPAARFTPDQLLRIKRDPNLIVQDVEAVKAASGAREQLAKDYGKMTVAALTGLLEEAGIAIPEGAKKADLVELLIADAEK